MNIQMLASGSDFSHGLDYRAGRSAPSSLAGTMNSSRPRARERVFACAGRR